MIVKTSRSLAGRRALQGCMAATLLCIGGLAAAQTSPPVLPAPMPTATTPALSSMTSTLPGYTGNTGTVGNTGTLVDPSGTTVPKITPAPEPRG